MNLDKVKDFQLAEVISKIKPQKIEGVFEFTNSPEQIEKAVTVIENDKRKSYVFGENGLVAVVEGSLYEYSQREDKEHKFEETLTLLASNEKYEKLDNEFQRLMLVTLGDKYYKKTEQIYSKTILELETKLRQIESELSRAEFLMQNRNNISAEYLDELHERKDETIKLLQLARILDLRLYENHIGPIVESET